MPPSEGAVVSDAEVSMAFAAAAARYCRTCGHLRHSRRTIPIGLTPRTELGPTCFGCVDCLGYPELERVAA